MKFFLDEKFPKAAASLLEQYGNEVHDSRGTELEGAAVRRIVEEAQRLGAVILTTDRDFFHTLSHQFPGHDGVVVVALKQPNRAAILERLQWLLQNVPVSAYSGRAFQLRDKSCIARPPLD